MVGNLLGPTTKNFQPWKKLDRILVHKTWEALFPTALVYKLPREVSDHNPLILTTQINVPLRKLSFRFELSWVKEEDFVPNVKELWDRPCFCQVTLG
jgi:hypothetical protein